MKLLMYQDGMSRRLGVLRDGNTNEVVDIAMVAAATRSRWAPRDMLDLIDAGDKGLARVRELVARAETSYHSAVRTLQGLTILAPLDPPRGNVLAVGRNYLKHAEESARARNTPVSPPTIFTKAITTIAGPFDDIPLDPIVSNRVDWEVELGVVIGRRGRNIRRSDAHAHVFGYVVLNDLTARDIQHEWGGQWFKGKSLDGSCPTGPWIVTKDEVADPQALRLQLSVNGDVKQHGTTHDMIYPIDALVEWLSMGMTLLPGALIATGTPEGVGYARDPPEFLKLGDLIESEIAGIGRLRNRTVPADARR